MGPLSNRREDRASLHAGIGLPDLVESHSELSKQVSANARSAKLRRLGVSRSARRRSYVRLAGLVLASLTLLSLVSPRIPRSVEDIGAILGRGPHAGSCEQCHTTHSGGEVAEQHALAGPNDNALCDGCHEVPSWDGGSYAGMWAYVGSAHGSSPSLVWPGPDPPARIRLGDAGKCVNCHDPHGWKDSQGDIPYLAIAREEKLCLTCHDGNPAEKNVRTDFLKAFRHPAPDYDGRHTGPREASPADFAAAPVNRRHAECGDCHNPHVGRNPAMAGSSNAILGVSRVLVQNGAAGTPPTYRLVAASDTLSAAAEYTLCFKCHSSWTVQPSRQTDLALVLNPANPSYHPVEAVGADPRIDPRAFSPGWSATSIVRCGDCHGSDYAGAAGPHGSIYRYLLRQPYPAPRAEGVMSPGDLCFSCHAYDVYANPDAPELVRRASRFNAPGAVKGHAEHVGVLGVTCYACHTTHGSTKQRHLIETERRPGLVSFTELPTGGTCAPTCHAVQRYELNYAR